MFAFFPYMPFGTAPAGVPCQPMPSVSFFSYPTQPTPIFMHPSPAGMLPSPSSSPPAAPSPFLLYPSQPMPCIMPPGAPVLFSASPPSVLPSPNLSSSPPTTTTCCSRRLPYLQPSPSPSTSPSTSPRSSSTSETAATTTTTTTAPIPIPKATATGGPRGGSHGINCTCKSNGGGSSGGRNPSTAELSLTVLATTPRKEQRDPAYAEKLERYRNKMRRTAPMADPQRSLQASKRKRDAMGKFIKGEEVGRRTSARVDEIKIEAEAASGPPPPSAEQVRQHEEQHRRAEDRAGDAKNEEEERKRREEENFSPRTRVNFLLN